MLDNTTPPVASPRGLSADLRDLRSTYPPITPHGQPPGEPPIESKTVRVELVWAAERGAMLDSRANTGVVWAGRGDVQDFPADKWHLLAPHPDVWRLVNPDDAKVAEQAKQDVVETPAARVNRLNAELALAIAERDSQNERDRKAAAQAKEVGAQTNTDVVTVVGDGTPLPLLDEERLADMSDEDIHIEGKKRGYTLHPRLNPVNLRAKFLEEQAETEAERQDEREAERLAEDAARNEGG